MGSIIYDIEDFSNNSKLVKPNGEIDKKNNQLFIPYYVGIASGDGKNISDRINDHHHILMGDGLKKTRLTKGYLKEIQSVTSLSANIKKMPSDFLNVVNYFNDNNFLNKKYDLELSNGKKNNYPINLQDLKVIPNIDSLNEFINKKNNFSFLYCPIENLKEDLYNENENKVDCLFHQLHFKTNLTYLESYVFYSLKGITISNCHVLDTVNKVIIPCLINSNTSLIKLSASGCNEIFKFTDAVSFNSKEINPSYFPCDY